MEGLIIPGRVASVLDTPTPRLAYCADKSRKFTLQQYTHNNETYGIHGYIIYTIYISYTIYKVLLIGCKTSTSDGDDQTANGRYGRVSNVSHDEKKNELNNETPTGEHFAYLYILYK